jgi:hypothetical protein
MTSANYLYPILTGIKFMHLIGLVVLRYGNFNSSFCFEKSQKIYYFGHLGIALVHLQNFISLVQVFSINYVSFTYLNVEVNMQ